MQSAGRMLYSLPLWCAQPHGISRNLYTYTFTGTLMDPLLKKSRGAHTFMSWATKIGSSAQKYNFGDINSPVFCEIDVSKDDLVRRVDQKRGEHLCGNEVFTRVVVTIAVLVGSGGCRVPKTRKGYR